MFGSDRPNFDEAHLHKAASAAYEDLAAGVAAVTGPKSQDDGCLRAYDLAQSTNIAAVWALAHGLADLLAAGRLKSLQALDATTRNRVVASIVSRALPATLQP